jgi:hypothetical protein
MRRSFMSEILTHEIKNDLENIYKLTGDLLNMISMKDFSSEKSEIQEMMEMIKFRLADIGGILQKDIFNCDYLLMKMRTLESRRNEVTMINAHMN